MIRTVRIAILVCAACAMPAALHASAQSEIPAWIKEVAGFWADDQTTDGDFIGVIQYLIDEGVIRIPDARNDPGADKLTIGLIPIEKADKLTSEAQELEEFLEERIPGVDIEIVIPTNYETIIEGMRFGHIDAAFMDTGPAWITHQRTGAEAVLAEVVGGKTSYQATVWTLADDHSVQSLEDVLGKRVAFTSITGSSGFIRPVGSLVTSGQIQIQGNDVIALEQALRDSFEEHTFTGGYKAALQLLLGGNVDVAFGSDIAPKKYLDAGEQARLKSVATVGEVPSHVFMVHPDMPDYTRKALTGALVELNYEENNKILTDLYGADALLPTSTIMHIGDFGENIDALAGIDRLILDKYDKSK